MREVNEQEMKEIIESEPKVLVDFYSTSCAPCRVLGSILEKIETEYEIIKVQVTESLAEEYGISALPHVVIINDAKKIDEFVGLLPKSKIEALLV